MDSCDVGMTAEGSNTFFRRQTWHDLGCRAGTPIPAGQTQHQQPSEKRQKRAPANYQRKQNGFHLDWGDSCIDGDMGNTIGGGNRRSRPTREPGMNSRQKQSGDESPRSKARAMRRARNQSKIFRAGLYTLPTPPKQVWGWHPDVCIFFNSAITTNTQPVKTHNLECGDSCVFGDMGNKRVEWRKEGTGIAGMRAACPLF